MNIISNATRNAVKALNRENRKALRGLAENFRFDLEKPFFLARLDGKFTFNSIKKLIPAEHAGNAAILVKKKDSKHRREDKFYLVRIDPTRFYVGERYGRFKTWDFDLDYFFGVGDFEDARKNATDHYYIISQSRDYMRSAERKTPIDKKGRHEIRATWSNCVKMLDEFGREWEYRRSYYPGKTDKLPILDKSGYLYADAVTELYTRLKAYKAAKREADAEKMDFNSEEGQIIKSMQEKRATIAALWATPKTADEIKELERMTNKFYWAVCAWETYQEKRNESSATWRRARLEGIKKDLEKVQFTLYTGGANNEIVA